VDRYMEVMGRLGAEVLTPADTGCFRKEITRET
jgi:hypothetical protein